MFSYIAWSYTLDPEHGFGIHYPDRRAKGRYLSFYEDGTLHEAGAEPPAGDAIRCLLKEGQDDIWGRRKTLPDEQIIKLYNAGVCSFAPGKDDGLDAVLSLNKQTITVRTAKGRYSFMTACSCSSRSCPHVSAAAKILQIRLNNLMHRYVLSPLPVDKTLFLDPYLRQAVVNLDERDIDMPLIRSLRGILQLLDAPGSDDYYRRFHNDFLDLSTYDYDSRFLEDTYEYLMLALFEDAGYRRAVIDPGGFADPEPYEDRQHRSNRACLKRVLKEHDKVVRDLDVKGNYQEDTYAELILKARGDRRALLRYYAEGKAKLDLFDLPFLEEIAADPDADPHHILCAAGKLDALGASEDAVSLFRRLAAMLPVSDRVKLYGSLRTITVPIEEICLMPAEDQLRLVRSIAVTETSVTQIMEHMLKDAGFEVKGRFLLSVTRRLLSSKNVPLKKTVAGFAARLPHNRLLLAYILDSLHIQDRFPAAAGDPEKELTAYFTCRYEIVNLDSEYYSLFHVTDPEQGVNVLSAIEREGGLGLYKPWLLKDVYSPELIRKAALSGHEEEYRRECEKNQDAVDAWHFEKKYKKFASEYRKLCDNLADEKLMFSEDARAQIEWQLIREEGSNALAFRVGQARKYVVKDASEFIRAFRTGQTTEYGRDLILTHDPENLQEDDAAAIRLLTSAKYTKGRHADPKNKRYVTVSDSLLCSLIETLGGRTILYGDSPMRIRLEKAAVRLRISDSYVLSTDLDSKTQEYWNLAGKGFLVRWEKDRKGALLDRVDASAEEAGLIDLVCRNPGVNIRPILNDFQRNIYSRFFERFDVSAKVQGAFARSQIRLNTYFDLERSAITARTVITRGGQTVPERSLSSKIELARYELLQNYLSQLGFENGLLTDEGRMLAFFKLDFTRLKSLTNVYLSESLQNKEIRSVGRPVIRVSYQNNMVSVFLEKSGYSEEELAKIIAGLRKKKKFILLDGDRIIDLDSEAARDLGEAVKDFDMDPKDLYKKKKISFVTALKAFSHEKSCRVDKYLRDMIEEIRSFKEADLTPPKLNTELRDYQTEGFKWMSVLSRYGMGGILADDMGLGKTIQVIALIRSDRTRRPSLVVCPKSLIFNWVSEFARFDGQTAVTAVYGTDSRRSEIIASIDYHSKGVYVTSYDSLRSDIAKYTGEFHYGILDEAQYIKNVHAQKTRSVKELKVTHRFALTGTPIENSVVDLWSIFDFILPGYFDDLSQMKNSPAAAIARKAAPFILRRVKEDVLEELPAKFERILSADMTEPQKKVYEAMRMEARSRMAGGGKAFDMLPYLTRLRQICVDPGLFVDGYSGGSGKMDMLGTLVPEYLGAGHRILIFSQFVRALEAVSLLLKSKGIDSYFLSGATPAAERLEMMEAFNAGGGADVFLISLKAGGTGLNLTGADTVIHLDPWWNAAAENQASDRAHRIGQVRNVEVIKLIAQDSIEQRVVQLQDIKKQVIREVISDNDGSVTSASFEDIAFVLE